MAVLKLLSVTLIPLDIFVLQIQSKQDTRKDKNGRRGESWGNTAYRLSAGVSLFVSETTEKYCCVCFPWSFPCFNNFQLGNETELSKSFRLRPENESWLKSVIWFELEARLQAQAESVSC